VRNCLQFITPPKRRRQSLAPSKRIVTIVIEIQHPLVLAFGGILIAALDLLEDSILNGHNHGR
jgi:hypothetical protein